MASFVSQECSPGLDPRIPADPPPPPRCLRRQEAPSHLGGLRGVGSLLLGKARYTPWEYANVALIVGGTVLVSSAKGGKAGGSSSAAGLSFLVAKPLRWQHPTPHQDEGNSTGGGQPACCLCSDLDPLHRLPRRLRLASLVCDGVVAGVQKRLKKTLNDAGVKQRNFGHGPQNHVFAG